MSEIMNRIEARIEKQAKADVSDLETKMKALYKGALGINYSDSFTHAVDEQIRILMETLIAPKLLPKRVDFYNDKFFSQLENATEILTRFIGEQP